jgi:hypothetical protein
MHEKRAALLRTHQLNIARYQRLLKFNLNKAETNFLEGRLAEERFAVAILDFMNPDSHSAAVALQSAYTKETAIERKRIRDESYLP